MLSILVKVHKGPSSFSLHFFPVDAQKFSQAKSSGFWTGRGFEKGKMHEEQKDKFGVMG